MSKKIIFDKDTLIRLYTIDNKTVEKIAKELNCSTATINRQLKKYNIKKQKSKDAQLFLKQNKVKQMKKKLVIHDTLAKHGKAKDLDKFHGIREQKDCKLHGIRGFTQ